MQGMRTQIKRALTLIELLLVIMLITVSLGALGISIPKALKKEGLEKAVHHVLAKISLAREMALDYQADMLLILRPEENQGKKYSCEIRPMQHIPVRAAQAANRHRTIQGVDKMSYGELNGVITIRFSSGIVSEPQGVLKLFCDKNEAAILLGNIPKKAENNGACSQNVTQPAPYPEEILSAF